MKIRHSLFYAVLICFGQLTFAQKSILGTTYLGGEGGYGTFFRHDVNSGNTTLDHVLYGIPGIAHAANSLVHAGNGIYYGLGSGLGNYYSDTWGSVFKFDIATGEFETIAELGENSPFGATPKHNPILHNNHLYLQTNTKLVRLNLTTSAMTVIVDFQNNGIFPVQAMDRMDLIKIGNVLYYVGGDLWYTRNYIYKYDLDTETGSLVYENWTNSYFSTARAHNNLIYIGLNNSLAVYNTVTDTYSVLAPGINSTMHGANPISLTIDNDAMYIEFTGGGAHNNGALVKYDLLQNSFSNLYNYQYSSAAVTPYGGGGHILIDNNKLKMIHRYDFANNDGNSVWFEYNLTTQEVEITSMGLKAETAGHNLHFSQDLNAYVFMGRYGIFAWDEDNNDLTQFIEFDKAEDYGFLSGSRVRNDNMIYGFARTFSDESGSDRLLYAHDITNNSLTILEDLTALVNEENISFYDLLVYREGKIYGFLQYGVGGGGGARPTFNGDIEAYTSALAEAQEYEMNRAVSRYLYSYDINSGQLELIQEMTNGYRWFHSLIDVNGVLYGNCSSGGTDDAGAIFSYNLSDNSFSVVYEYTEDYNPWSWAGTIQYANGSLFGAMPYSDLHSNGYLFEYKLAQSEFTVLHEVDIQTEGRYPQALEISEDIIYVISSENVDGVGGFVWSYDLSNESVNVLATLDAAVHGSYTYQNPIIFEDVLYFQTSDDAIHGFGAILALDLDDDNLSIILNYGPEYGGMDYSMGVNLIALDFCEIDNYEVTLLNGVLTANPSGASFEWVNCNDTETVLATTQNFSPTESGEYQVYVNNGDCSFESACIQVTVSGANLDAHEQTSFSMHPNPAKDEVILSGLAFTNTITVIDLMGRIVETLEATDTSIKINTSQHASGVYHIEVRSLTGLSSQKLIVQ